MKRYVRRFTLLTLIGASVSFAALLSGSSANIQQRDRLIAKKPWRLEPVKIVAARTKNKGSVELGQPFEEDDDWLDGLTLTVANNYHKTVTALTVGIIFRRDEGDSRPPFAYNLRFGPSPDIREYLNRDPNKVIRSGKTLDLNFSHETYQVVNVPLKRLGTLAASKELN